MPAFIDHFLHIDAYLISLIALYGKSIYFLLFLLFFCETGLIITPFLPGDSVLFALGGLSALDNSPISLCALFLLLTAASILGNQVNYLIGRAIGPRIFTVKGSWLFNPLYLEKAHLFYEKKGPITIILARFLPIIRTFVPFVAGVAQMRNQLFTFYNGISAVCWIGSLLSFGYFLGNFSIIKENFSAVIYGIIIITLLPSIMVFISSRKNRTRPKQIGERNE